MRERLCFFLERLALLLLLRLSVEGDSAEHDEEDEEAFLLRRGVGVESFADLLLLLLLLLLLSDERRLR